MMEIIVTKDYDAMSQLAAERMAKAIKAKPDATLGMATGGTMEQLYTLLVAMYERGEIDFSQIKAFNLDEYVGLAADHPCSYHYYMNERLYAHVNAQAHNIYLPDGIAADLQAECNRYEQAIAAAGGMDLQMLGIGTNGHIGFNEPGSSASGRTSVVQLADSTIQANARYFDSIDEVPKQAITVGIGTILDHSKKIILLANGDSKAEAIQKMIEGEPTEAHPASLLQNHNDVTVIIDEQAAKLLK